MSVEERQNLPTCQESWSGCGRRPCLLSMQNDAECTAFRTFHHLRGQLHFRRPQTQATSSKHTVTKATRTRASLLGARTLLVAPGLTTRNKKLLDLLVAPGIVTIGFCVPAGSEAVQARCKPATQQRTRRTMQKWKRDTSKLVSLIDSHAGSIVVHLSL